MSESKKEHHMIVAARGQLQDIDDAILRGDPMVIDEDEDGNTVTLRDIRQLRVQTLRRMIQKYGPSQSGGEGESPSN